MLPSQYHGRELTSLGIRRAADTGYNNIRPEPVPEVAVDLIPFYQAASLEVMACRICGWMQSASSQSRSYLRVCRTFRVIVQITENAAGKRVRPWFKCHEASAPAGCLMLECPAFQ